MGVKQQFFVKILAHNKRLYVLLVIRTVKILSLLTFLFFFSHTNRTGLFWVWWIAIYTVVDAHVDEQNFEKFFDTHNSIYKLYGLQSQKLDKKKCYRSRYHTLIFGVRYINHKHIFCVGINSEPERKHHRDMYSINPVFFLYRPRTRGSSY